MNSFDRLAAAIRNAETEYEENRSGSALFKAADRFFAPSENVLALGDNLGFIKALAAKQEPSLRPGFVYIDPPFFTGNSQIARLRIAGGDGTTRVLNRRAYSDRASGGLEGYLSALAVRLLAIRDLMADDGIIAVHLDWHAVHYAKLLLDGIFGYDRFINEVIWSYKSGGYGGRSFAKKHDTILIYSKGKSYYFKPQKEKSYNRGYKPYRFKGVEEFEDELGWYTLVNRKDVMSVDMVGRSSPERTGYATQKPQKLADILLESFAPQGAVIADFYAGSGTTAAAAAEKGMSFICCDSNPSAVSTSVKRLAASGTAFDIMMQEGIASEEEPRVTLSRGQLSMGEEKQYMVLSCERSLDSLGLKGKTLSAMEKSASSNPLAMAELAAAGKTENGLFIAREPFFPTSKGKELIVNAGSEDTHIKVWDKFGGSAVISLS